MEVRGGMASPGDEEPTLGPWAILSPELLWAGAGVQFTADMILIIPLKTGMNAALPDSFEL